MSSIDNDEGNDDLIDRNPFNLTINPSTNDSWSSLITTNGFYDKVRFTVQVQLSCSTGWTSIVTAISVYQEPAVVSFSTMTLETDCFIPFFLYSSN